MLPHVARRERRRAMAEDAPLWWPGLQRFLFAALMAAALLVVITTIQRWHRAPAPLPPPTRPQQAAAVEPDAGLIDLAPAANAAWTPSAGADDAARQEAEETAYAVRATADPAEAWQFDAVPSGPGWADAGEPPGGVVAPAAQWTRVPSPAADATGYADGSGVSAAAYVYPSTSRLPVVPELSAPSAAVPAGHPTERQVDRIPPDGAYRQR